MKRKLQLMLAVLSFAACGVVPAQKTNAPPKSDYAFFKIIAERNIFNPNRRPHVVETVRRAEPVVRVAPVDAFSLVGTMSYAKGTFAFFTGSSTDYQKVLKRDGEIAGFKVSAIEPDDVQLTASNKTVELNVGEQMRRDAAAGWRLAHGVALPPSGQTNETASSSTAGDATANPSDILKKLMQRREEELK